MTDYLYTSASKTLWHTSHASTSNTETTLSAHKPDALGVVRDDGIDAVINEFGNRALVVDGPRNHLHAELVRSSRVGLCDKLLIADSVDCFVARHAVDRADDACADGVGACYPVAVKVVEVDAAEPGVRERTAGILGDHGRVVEEGDSHGFGPFLLDADDCAPVERLDRGAGSESPPLEERDEVRDVLLDGQSLVREGRIELCFEIDVDPSIAVAFDQVENFFKSLDCACWVYWGMSAPLWDKQASVYSLSCCGNSRSCMSQSISFT